MIDDKTERQAIMAKLDIKPPNVHKKVTLRVKADTGANGNILPTRCLHQIYPDSTQHSSLLQPTRAVLQAANDTIIPTKGTIRFPVKLDDSKWLNLLFYVCDTSSAAILSCDASESLGIISVRKSQNISTITSMAPPGGTAHSMIKPPDGTTHIPDTLALVGMYQDRFQGIGMMKDPYKIELKPDADPYISPPRKYPIKLKNEIVEKINEMAELGVVKKCNDDEASEWIHPLAFTRKANGDLRVCLDPRQLNVSIKRTYHKTPTIDEISHKLSGAKSFSKMDAKHGYWGIQLDEESSKLCTFHSPAGKYRFVRLPFGLSVSQDVFQARMDKILNKVGEGVIGIADDVIVYGKTTEEHDANLHKLMTVARQEGLVFRQEKCHINQDKIEFFGIIWSKDGMQPDPKKCDDITNRPAPTNVKGLQSFIGLVQYMSPFIPNLAEKTKVLRQLLKKDTPYEWTAEYEKAFQEVKDSIHTDMKLRYFDPNEPIQLEVDASLQGLGAALMQHGKPVAFASKSLTPAETRYANIEREMLSVVFGLEHFHCYVYGQQVTVISDHKPLESIALKQLNKAPPRLQRMLLRIQPYDVTIKYKPGQQLIFADYLSRVFPTKGEEIYLENTIHTIQISQNQLDKVKTATSNDEELSALREQIIAGWPKDVNVIPKCIRAYASIKDFLSVEDGVIFYGERLVIPRSMHEEYLRRIHEGHMGINKCILRAKECVYWKDMNKQITQYVGDCQECLINARSNPKEPMLSHDTPTAPWQMIATDLFEFEGQMYILVADMYSKMPFVKKLGSGTRSSHIIEFMEELFSVHGACHTIISDNGPQYSSKEFQRFVEDWDVKHTTSSPHYPKSNGFAERMIGIVKGIMRKSKMAKENVHKAMLAYRSCPLNSECNKSPAELMFKRKLITNLPTRQTAPTDVQDHHEHLLNMKQKSKDYYDRNAKTPLSDLLPGMKVLVQDGKNWYPATVKEKSSEPRSYIVTTANGSEIRRNRKFLKEISKEASQKFTFRNTEAAEVPEKVNEDLKLPNAKPLDIQNEPRAETPETNKCKRVRFSDEQNSSVAASRQRRNVQKPKRLIEET
jgi:transposase InsO family protein